MSVSFCLPHPVAVSVFMICRGLCACTEMLWMCVLYVSFGSKVRPRTFGCVAMGSALLFIVRSRLLVYSAGSGVNRVGSKLSPSLFNYYIADMPRPTPPVNRGCYADDITVWASGPKIPPLESMINSYLTDVRIYLKENSLLISAPKSTVTLFPPPPRTNTSSRRIPILLLKTHSYHWSGVLKY